MVGRAVVVLALALVMAGCTSGEDAMNPTTAVPALATTTVLETTAAPPTTAPPPTVASSPSDSGAPTPSQITGMQEAVSEMLQQVDVVFSNPRRATDTTLGSPRPMTCVDVSLTNSGASIPVVPISFEFRSPAGKALGPQPYVQIGGGQAFPSTTSISAGANLTGVLCAASDEHGAWSVALAPIGVEVATFEFRV